MVKRTNAKALSLGTNSTTLKKSVTRLSIAASRQAQRSMAHRGLPPSRKRLVLIFLGFTDATSKRVSVGRLQRI